MATRRQDRTQSPLADDPKRGAPPDPAQQGPEQAPLRQMPEQQVRQMQSGPGAFTDSGGLLTRTPEAVQAIQEIEARRAARLQREAGVNPLTTIGSNREVLRATKNWVDQQARQIEQVWALETMMGQQYLAQEEARRQQLAGESMQLEGEFLEAAPGMLGDDAYSDEVVNQYQQAVESWVGRGGAQAEPERANRVMDRAQRMRLFGQQSQIDVPIIEKQLPKLVEPYLRSNRALDLPGGVSVPEFYPNLQQAVGEIFFNLGPRVGATDWTTGSPSDKAMNAVNRFIDEIAEEAFQEQAPTPLRFGQDAEPGFDMDAKEQSVPMVEEYKQVLRQMTYDMIERAVRDNPEIQESMTEQEVRENLGFLADVLSLVGPGMVGKAVGKGAAKLAGKAAGKAADVAATAGTLVGSAYGGAPDAGTEAGITQAKDVAVKEGRDPRQVEERIRDANASMQARSAVAMAAVAPFANVLARQATGLVTGSTKAGMSAGGRSILDRLSPSLGSLNRSGVGKLMERAGQGALTGSGTMVGSSIAAEIWADVAPEILGGSGEADDLGISRSRPAREAWMKIVQAAGEGDPEAVHQAFVDMMGITEGDKGARWFMVASMLPKLGKSVRERVFRYEDDKPISSDMRQDFLNLTNAELNTFQKAYDWAESQPPEIRDQYLEKLDQQYKEYEQSLINDAFSDQRVLPEFDSVNDMIAEETRVGIRARDRMKEVFGSAPETLDEVDALIRNIQEEARSSQEAATDIIAAEQVRLLRMEQDLADADGPSLDRGREEALIQRQINYIRDLRRWAATDGSIENMPSRSEAVGNFDQVPSGVPSDRQRNLRLEAEFGVASPEAKSEKVAVLEKGDYVKKAGASLAWPIIGKAGEVPVALIPQSGVTVRLTPDMLDGAEFYTSPPQVEAPESVIRAWRDQDLAVDSTLRSLDIGGFSFDMGRTIEGTPTTPASRLATRERDRRERRAGLKKRAAKKRSRQAIRDEREFEAQEAERLGRRAQAEEARDAEKLRERDEQLRAEAERERMDALSDEVRSKILAIEDDAAERANIESDIEAAKSGDGEAVNRLFSRLRNQPGETPTEKAEPRKSRARERFERGEARKTKQERSGEMPYRVPTERGQQREPSVERQVVNRMRDLRDRVSENTAKRPKAPKENTPKAEQPQAQQPEAQQPRAEEPRVERPKQEAPKEAPKAEAPKEEPKTKAKAVDKAVKQAAKKKGTDPNEASRKVEREEAKRAEEARQEQQRLEEEQKRVVREMQEREAAEEKKLDPLGFEEDSKEAELMRVFNEEQPKLQKIALKAVQDVGLSPDMADDALQDALVSVFNNLDGVKKVSGAVFTNKIRTAAKNLAARKATSDKSRAKLVEVREDIGQTSEPSFVPAMDKELEDQITEVLEVLPEGRRQVLEMWLNNIPHKEIAEKLGISVAKSRKDLQRALALFKGSPALKNKISSLRERGSVVVFPRMGPDPKKPKPTRAQRLRDTMNGYVDQERVYQGWGRSMSTALKATGVQGIIDEIKGDILRGAQEKDVKATIESSIDTFLDENGDIRQSLGRSLKSTIRRTGFFDYLATGSTIGNKTIGDGMAALEQTRQWIQQVVQRARSYYDGALSPFKVFEGRELDGALYKALKSQEGRDEFLKKYPQEAERLEKIRRVFKLFATISDLTNVDLFHAFQERQAIRSQISSLNEKIMNFPVDGDGRKLAGLTKSLKAAENRLEKTESAIKELQISNREFYAPDVIRENLTPLEKQKVENALAALQNGYTIDDINPKTGRVRMRKRNKDGKWVPVRRREPTFSHPTYSNGLSWRQSASSLLFANEKVLRRLGVASNSVQESFRKYVNQAQREFAKRAGEMAMYNEVHGFMYAPSQSEMMEYNPQVKFLGKRAFSYGEAYMAPGSKTAYLGRSRSRDEGMVRGIVLYRGQDLDTTGSWHQTGHEIRATFHQGASEADTIFVPADRLEGRLLISKGGIKHVIADVYKKTLQAFGEMPTLDEQRQAQRAAQQARVVGDQISRHIEVAFKRLDDALDSPILEVLGKYSKQLKTDELGNAPIVARILSSFGRVPKYGMAMAYFGGLSAIPVMLKIGVFGHAVASMRGGHYQSIVRDLGGLRPGLRALYLLQRLKAKPEMFGVEVKGDGVVVADNKQLYRTLKLPETEAERAAVLESKTGVARDRYLHRLAMAKFIESGQATTTRYDSSSLVSMMETLFRGNVDQARLDSRGAAEGLLMSLPSIITNAKFRDLYDLSGDALRDVAGKFDRVMFSGFQLAELVSRTAFIPEFVRQMGRHGDETKAMRLATQFTMDTQGGLNPLAQSKIQLGPLRNLFFLGNWAYQATQNQARNMGPTSLLTNILKYSSIMAAAGALGLEPFQYFLPPAVENPIYGGQAAGIEDWLDENLGEFGKMITLPDAAFFQGAPMLDATYHGLMLASGAADEQDRDWHIDRMSRVLTWTNPADWPWVRKMMEAHRAKPSGDGGLILFDRYDMPLGVTLEPDNVIMRIARSIAGEEESALGRTVIGLLRNFPLLTNQGAYREATRLQRRETLPERQQKVINARSIDVAEALMGRDSGSVPSLRGSPIEDYFPSASKNQLVSELAGAIQAKSPDMPLEQVREEYEDRLAYGVGKVLRRQHTQSVLLRTRAPSNEEKMRYMAGILEQQDPDVRPATADQIRSAVVLQLMGDDVRDEADSFIEMDYEQRQKALNNAYRWVEMRKSTQVNYDTWKRIVDAVQRAEQRAGKNEKELVGR